MPLAIHTESPDPKSITRLQIVKTLRTDSPCVNIFKLCQNITSDLSISADNFHVSEDVLIGLAWLVWYLVICAYTRLTHSLAWSHGSRDRQ